MTFFSTPELLELGNVPFTVTNIRPTRVEVLEYYRKVVDFFDLNLQLHTRITKIEKQDDSFILTAENAGRYQGKNMIVATGYFDQTNRLNIKGEDMPHVTHYYTEPFVYSRSRVAVIGGRNSAVETALDLYRHGTDVTLIHRGPALGSVKYWVLPDIENRIKEGIIKAYFNHEVKEISKGSLILNHCKTDKSSSIDIDFVIAHIGYRPDEHLLRSIGVILDDETLIPAYDSQTFETNVKGIYIAGSVACGCKVWDIFIENGKKHAQPIIKNIRCQLME